MAYIQSYKCKWQSWLLPPSIEDLIPEDHICFLIEGLIDSPRYTQDTPAFRMGCNGVHWITQPLILNIQG